MIYALWYGGNSYAAPDLADLEVFDTVNLAREAFRSRYEVGDRIKQDVVYADSRVVSVYFPAVDTDSEMSLYFSDPRESNDPYPDRLLTFGPRGGVVAVTP